MDHVLVTYDIAERLKIANPSGVLRRFGVRLNLSCWVIPLSAVPTDYLEQLQAQGADVQLLNFSERDWEKVLALAKRELTKHGKKIIEDVEDRITELVGILDEAIATRDESAKKAGYRRWRSVISKARRDLVASEQCAFGFGITRDVEEIHRGVQKLLEAELGAALAWKEAHLDEGVVQEPLAVGAA